MATAPLAFSPDGAQVAFVRTGSVGIQDLYVVPVTGGEPPPADVRQPAHRWTGMEPGRRLHPVLLLARRQLPALADDAPLGPRAGRQRGGKTRRRSRFLAMAGGWPSLAASSRPISGGTRCPERGGPAAAPESLIASTRYQQGPQYSPDGQRVVFASTRTGAWEIWVCDKDGRNPPPTHLRRRTRRR